MGLALCILSVIILIKWGGFFLTSHFAFYSCQWSQPQKPVIPRLGCQPSPRDGKERSPERPPVSASTSHPCPLEKGTEPADRATTHKLTRWNVKQRFLIPTFPQIKAQLQGAHAPHVPSTRCSFSGSRLSETLNQEIKKRSWIKLRHLRLEYQARQEH